MDLVVDASVVVVATLASDGFAPLRRYRLLAPPLLWAETRSALRMGVWSGRIDEQDGLDALDALEIAPIAAKSPKALGRTAWRIASDLGWARTYDAEYVALATLQGCRLLTADVRLIRGTARLDIAFAPDDL